jgi:pyruvate carboxylase subunit B
LDVTTYVVVVAGEEITVHLNNEQVILNGQPVKADIQGLGGGAYSVVTEEDRIRVISARVGENYEVLCAGIPAQVSVETERSRLLKRFAATSGTEMKRAELHAPMPALVVKVEVEVGQTVEIGQGLMILEAMKMENELRAPRTGRVKEICATKGKAVEKGELLLVLE